MTSLLTNRINVKKLTKDRCILSKVLLIKSCWSIFYETESEFWAGIGWLGIIIVHWNDRDSSLIYNDFDFLTTISLYVLYET